MDYINIHTHHLNKTEGIFQILNADIREKDKLDKLVEEKKIHLSLGIHPWYIIENKIAEQERMIMALAENANVMMIGESGIDHLCSVDIKLQMKVFEKMIEISEEFKKPLIIHNVKSSAEIIEFHKSTNPFQPWIIHGFRGNEILAGQLIDKGLYLSFGYIYNKDDVKQTPINRLFIENDEATTDIREVYKMIAKDLDIEVKDLKEQIGVNLERIIPSVKL